MYGRDRFRCRYCAQKIRWSTGTLDHVIPYCANGPSTYENLVTACHQCNSKKMDKYLDEIGWVLLPCGTRVIDLPRLGIEPPPHVKYRGANTARRPKRKKVAVRQRHRVAA